MKHNKGIRMKRLLASLSRIVAAVVAMALLLVTGRANTLATWIEDSPSGFFVSISGTLTSQGRLEYQDLISASGLWDVQNVGSSITFAGDGSSFGGWAHADVYATAGQFLGDHPFSFNTAGGYGSTISSLPSGGSSSMHGLGEGDNGSGWFGYSETTFLSATNIDDLSTWRYKVDVRMSPPAKVGDSGATSGLCAASISTLFWFRRRFTRSR